MLSFLNTWLLLGLAGVSIPVLIHLFARKKRIRVEFSSIHFLKNIEIKNIRHIKWIQNLLLILRCLALFFIILAFARPAWKMVQGFGSSNSRKNIAIILDRSLSMQREQIFDNAKQLAIDFIQHDNNKNQIQIFWDPSKEIRDGQDSEKIIQITECTLQKNDYTTAIQRAVDWLDNQPQNPGQIIYISDFQITAKKTQNDTLFKKLKYPLILLPVHQSVPNISIIRGGLKKQMIQPERPVELFAEVMNWSDQAIQDLVLRVYLKNKTIMQKSIALDPGEKKIVTFQIRPEKPGRQWGRIELFEDVFLHDNAYYFQFKIPEKMNILLIASDDDSDVIQSALTPKSQEYNFYQIQKFSDKSNHLLANDIDVIILNQTRDLTLKDYQDILTFLKNGGNLFCFLNKRMDMRLLSSNLLSPIANITVNNIIQANRTTGTSFFSYTQLDWQHPLFDDLLNSEAKEIESPQFYDIFNLTGNWSEPVAIYQNGIPAILDLNVNRGKLLLFNGDFNTASSNLMYTTLFAPLMHRTLFYLADENIVQNQSVSVGEVIALSLDKQYKTGQFTVESPEGDIFYLSPNWHLNQVLFEKTSSPGLYHFFLDHIHLGVVAVNVDPDETCFDADLTLMQSESDKIRILDPEKDFIKQIEAFNTGWELNRLLLIIGFFLLLLEMVLVKIPARTS